MIDKRKILIAGATILVAFGVGQLMPSGDAIAARMSIVQDEHSELGTGSELPDQYKLVMSLPTPPTEAVLPQRQHIRIPGNTSRVAAVTFPIDTDLMMDVSTPLLNVAACDAVLTALPAPGALVRLALNAPCNRNQRIVVTHSGLEFADVTDVDGNYSADVPALEEDASFSVTFADGKSVEAETLMLTLDGYERAVIMWHGKQDLHIHALELNADFGGRGHVWAQAARDPEVGVRAEGGFLTQLGNPDVFNPRLAEVYSFPYGRVKNDGPVELIVEATVSEQTCSTNISAKSMQMTGMGKLVSTDVVLAMPDCDGENGFLVLKNLLINLNIA